MGFARMRYNTLMHWGVFKFRKTWSEEKLARIIARLAYYLDTHRVTVLCLKVVRPASSSEELDSLMTAIMDLAHSKGITLHLAFIDDLELQYTDETVANVTMLIDAVTKRHPELKHTLQRHTESKNPYYLKVFEAVACADFASPPSRG
jgi:hypothetical protein